MLGAVEGGHELPCATVNNFLSTALFIFNYSFKRYDIPSYLSILKYLYIVLLFQQKVCFGSLLHILCCR